MQRYRVEAVMALLDDTVEDINDNTTIDKNELTTTDCMLIGVNRFTKTQPDQITIFRA